jgi:hypothetical protein
VQLDCDPLSADGFQEIVNSANAAIDGDDLVAHARHYAALRKQIPCLEVAVPIEPWAEFLIGLAIVERATGHDWESHLATALTIFPDVGRSKAPAAIRDFAPGDPSTDGEALLTDGDFYLDGQKIDHASELRGIHIVQRVTKGAWQSRLLQDASYPDEWMAPSAGVEQVAAADSGGRSVQFAIAGLGGLGGSGQSVDNPGFLPTIAATGAVAGIASWGAVPLGSMGLGWDVAAPLQLGAAMGTDLFGGLELGGNFRAHVGGGITTVAPTLGDDARVVVLPAPHVGVVSTMPAGALNLDLAVGGGWTPAATHFRARSAILGGGKTAWLFGLEGAWTGAAFVDSLGRGVGVSRWRAGVVAGAVIGR